MIAERLTCPAEFQQHLTDIFGVNCFGDAIFRIVWAQTESVKVATPRGMEDRLVGHNQPCWLLQRWMAPELYGTPELYYWLNSDPATGLPINGEYPELGRYETIITFLHRSIDSGGALVIETIPLDWEVIERAIPVLLASNEMTYWQQKAAIESQEAWENAQLVQQIADRLHDDLPTFYGPVSYAGQGNRTALIDRKKAEIESKWKQMGGKRYRPQRGFFQGN